MTSNTVSSLFLVFLGCSAVLAQTQQVQFNQVLNINGDMSLNSFQFPDRSKVETFSQKQQQIIVNQQNPAIPANQVTGTTGQPFVAISPQSMTISTNGATDLVGGQVQMTMSQQNLQAAAVQPGNTYVAMLSPDRQTWMIQETIRTVNSTDMTVRMVKRSQLDGEYMVVGRQTVETNTLVVPFGSSPANSVAISGTGLQENEFQDGFRMSTRATQPMTMNVNVKKGIDSSMLSSLQGQMSVNDYRYSVVTNLAAVNPSLNQQVTVVQMPIPAVRIQKMMQAANIPANGQVSIAVAQRGVLQNPGSATGNLGGAAVTRRGESRDDFRREVTRQIQAGQTSQTSQTGQTGQAGQAGQIQQGGTPTNGNNPVAAALLLAPTFTPIQANAVLDQVNMRIAVPVRQIDGEYILIMSMSGGAQAATPPQGQTPTPAEGQRPATGSQTPGARAPQSGAGATGGEQPASNGTTLAKPERRQESVKAPQGIIIMTMAEINNMAEREMWGGSIPVTRMMNDYVKEMTGSDLFAPANSTSEATSGIKIIV